MAPLLNLRHHRMFQEMHSTQENWKASHSPSSHTQGEAAQLMSVMLIQRRFSSVFKQLPMS